MKSTDRNKLDNLKNPFLTGIAFTAREITMTNKMVSVEDVKERNNS